MKKLALSIMIVTAICFSACQTPQINVNDDTASAAATTDKAVKTPIIEETSTATLKIIPSHIPEETADITEQVAEEPTPIPTTKPTAKPTEVPTPPTPIITPTPQPTAQPTAEPTPDNQNDVIPVSSAFIKAAIAQINRQREADGIASATYSGSISSSCKSHAIAMAESGEVFHASGTYMFEVVARVNKVMPGATMGSAAVAHVTQLKSEEVTKIGIGAVYYGNYLYYVVRGD